MPRGRLLSLTLLVIGVLLLAGGLAATLAVWFGLVVGLGVAVALVGAGLITGGLFLVPMEQPPSGERPIHGVIP